MRGRRAFLALLAGPALAAVPRTARIGVLRNRPSAGNAEQAAGASQFNRAMAALGWVQGRNLTITRRYAEGDPQKYPTLARELVQAQVDLVMAVGAEAAAAARHASASIPIVMWGVVYPVEMGLVASLARPGGNVTGLTTLEDELNLKTLELLREARPGMSKMAVLVAPSNPESARLFDDLQRGAARVGVTLLRLVVGSAADVDGALAVAQREHVQALFVLYGAAIGEALPRIQRWAVENQVMAVGASVSEGFLLGYELDTDEQIKALTTMVDRILRGAKPGELPVERPSKLDLTVNLRVAREIGLTIPPSVLLRADRVIE